MRISCTHKQSDKLRLIKKFPPADLVMEYYWVAKDHTVHMKGDRKFLKSYDGVDIIPAWSLPLMIEALPKEMFYTEDGESDTCYNLHILPGSPLHYSEVKYIQDEGTDVLYSTQGLELVDAVFEMIMKLNEMGWFDEEE